MLSNARLTEIDSFLEHAAATLAPKLFAFYHALDTAGFKPADALTLTVESLKAVLAVPSPTEQK